MHEFVIIDTDFIDARFNFETLIHRKVILSDTCHWSLPVFFFDLKNLRRAMNNMYVTGIARL